MKEELGKKVNDWCVYMLDRKMFGRRVSATTKS